ncbi:sugar transferase [Bacteroides ovatus]|jgi:undecaprenyl phosphate N,N'-diacetylbacillosamine 1-phosphate transferase|uniref:sugar transferase n=1 Tax=Bacteroides ovatus TaxID=28116 RepID=UPI0018972867|nr:sugar transferase [Bacteroides ovatus]MDC2648961.1 sugar transferase [Bacteroides ovatus]
MYKHFFKRVFDIIIGLCALPFVLLVIIICAPFIYFTDRGPVFYNATRAGKDYKPFKMFKLRSMYVNSPDLKNPDGSTFNSDNDPRVTPIGRIMRKTSLDEFPQFLNILLGDISFIGPRPKLYNPEKWKDGMPDFMEKSFKVKPGITGYAQAYFRNSITNDEKFKWDAYYAENISFMMDVKIIFKTVKSVLFRENINTEQSYKK